MTAFKAEGDMVIISKAEYEDLQKAKRNLAYLEMLDESAEQQRQGKVIVKTWEELDAMANV